MADISTIWETTRGDWQLAGPQLANGNDIITAVLISLFTNRVANPDDVINDMSGDPRGWWGDVAQYPIGSRLWLIERAKKTQATLALAKGYIEEAIQWLIDDGVASRIDVFVEWTRAHTLGAQVTVYAPLDSKPIVKIGTQNVFALPGVQIWTFNQDQGTGQFEARVLLPPVSNTVLLMHFEGANGSTAMVDAMGHNAYLYHVPGWAAEAASISTAAPIMGGGSLVCAPYQTAGSFSNIVCTIDSSPDFDLPGQFTIEFSQIGPLSTSSTSHPFCRKELDGISNIYTLVWAFTIQNLAISFSCINQNAVYATVSGTYVSGVLQRYAVTRDAANNLRLYIEGALVSTTIGVDSKMTGSQRISINGPYQTNNPLPNEWSAGKYDEIRITKGAALYTGPSYALATAPFPG